MHPAVYKSFQKVLSVSLYHKKINYHSLGKNVVVAHAQARTKKHFPGGWVGGGGVRGIFNFATGISGIILVI